MATPTPRGGDRLTMHHTYFKMDNARENVRVQVVQAFMEQSVMKRKDCEAMCRRFCQVSNGW